MTRPVDSDLLLAGSRRHATAARSLPDFGVAMDGGFGRQPGRDGAETMRAHAPAARVARTVRAR